MVCDDGGLDHHRHVGHVLVDDVSTGSAARQFHLKHDTLIHWLEYYSQTNKSEFLPGHDVGVEWDLEEERIFLVSLKIF